MNRQSVIITIFILLLFYGKSVDNLLEAVMKTGQCWRATREHAVDGSKFFRKSGQRYAIRWPFSFAFFWDLVLSEFDKLGRWNRLLFFCLSKGLKMANPSIIEWRSPEPQSFPLLDTHSTTQPKPSPYCFRDTSAGLVGDHHRRILEIYAYIAECGGHNLTKQYERCRTDAWLVQHEETRELRIASRKCNQRWCPMCQKTKRWLITNSVGDWVGQVKYPKFVTFTLKSMDQTLEFQVQRLYESFVAMRRTKIWRRSVRGGVWFFQLTVNKSTGLWHPHIHVLVDSDYMKKKTIADEWLKITSDSWIVDIRKVEDAEKAAEYVARYATIPGEILKCTIKQGSAMVIGLKGRRMCGVFGSAKGLSLRPKSSPEFVKWRKVMSYCSFVVGAKIDDYIALVAKAFHKGVAFEADIWGLYDTPDMPPDSTRFKPESAAQCMFEFDDCYYITGTC